MSDDSERLGHLTPEQKVLIAIDMTDGCMQFSDITDEELIEKLREKVEWARQNR
jgi:hypothetical protein